MSSLTRRCTNSAQSFCALATCSSHLPLMFAATANSGLPATGRIAHAEEFPDVRCPFLASAIVRLPVKCERASHRNTRPQSCADPLCRQQRRSLALRCWHWLALTPPTRIDPVGSEPSSEKKIPASLSATDCSAAEPRSLHGGADRA